jgi:phage FluMu protein Com
MITGRSKIRCPFCNQVGVVAFYKPPHREPSSSRISGKSVTKQILVDESYHIQSDCPHCGAEKKHIQAWYNGTYQEPRTHKEKIERLKKRGLPLVIGGK